MDSRKSQSPVGFFTLPNLALPSFLIFLGLIMIIFSLWPLIQWNFKMVLEWQNQSFASPLDEKTFFSNLPPIRKKLPPSSDIKVAKDEGGFSYFTLNDRSKGFLGYFWVSVEKLGLENAKVNIASLDFKKALAHFPGSALPGEVGNVFITGHSSHPSFFSATNYQTIFTHLSELEFGDKIQVFLADKKISYTVIVKKVVDSKDVEVLYPPDDWGKYLTLMSCVPPGVNTQRLVVLASQDEDFSH